MVGDPSGEVGMESWRDGEKSRVKRVLVGVGDERREYRDCWIVVGHVGQVVHVWEDAETGEPTVTAPLDAVLIEWGTQRGE
jgi:hypothetical protein